MKKIFLLCVAAVFVASTMTAQTADQVRIYINPGHGGWGPDDRPMATIPYPMLASTGRPDTCGFYESNTNLWKCLELGACLQRMGVQRSNIMYSRVKNGPYPYNAYASDAEAYDRNLSEIAAEVNANNMDMFISIHSDAASDGSTANYPLFLYRGYDSGEIVSGSYNMCYYCWGPHWESTIDRTSYYSETNMNIRGDISFYHGSNSNGYLGVLKHSTPGFLLEGYFHTYQPARHRALNKDYCGQEGIRVARGVCNYFGLNPETTGYIMGTIKDKNETISNSLFTYASGSNDQYMPVNGAKVKLLKDGNVVATYQVDYNYNGVFVFSGLEPGYYSFSIEKQGYNDLQGSENVSAWVSANATTYVNLHVVKNGETIVDDNPNTSTDTNTGVTFQSDYPNYREPTLASGTMAPSVLYMKQQSSNLALSGTVKRMLVHGDSTVILTNEGTTPHLYLVDNNTRSIIKEMSTNGIAAAETSNAGFYSRLNDIAFASDDKLIGVNSVRCQDTDDYVDDGYNRGTLRFYLWDNADSNPQTWFTTQDAGYYYRADMGGALAVNGPSYNCYVGTTAITSGSSRGIRFTYFSRVNGSTTATTWSNEAGSTTYCESAQGTNLQLAISPRSDYYWVFNGNATYPLEYQSGNEETDAPIIGRFSDAEVGVTSVGIQFFKYAKHQFMVTPFVKNDSIGGVRLYDITNGFDKATLVNTTNTELVEHDPSTTMGAGAQVKDGKIYLYLLHGNTFSSFEVDDRITTLIDKVENGGLSAAFNGDALVVSAPEPVKTVKVYSPSGSLVAQGASSTVNASQLTSGIYLVKVNNLPVVKAMKK